MIVSCAIPVILLNNFVLDTALSRYAMAERVPEKVFKESDAPRTLNLSQRGWPLRTRNSSGQAFEGFLGGLNSYILRHIGLGHF